MSFRLSVINPNSDSAVTRYLRDEAIRVLPAGSVVEAADCPQNPVVLETALDEVMAGPSVVAAAAAAASLAPGPDAFLVGCFGNPAVTALRELTAAPVLGIGEAALIEAGLTTTRFGIITTLERGVAALWSQLDAAGAARSCAGIRSAESAGPGPAHGDDLLARLTHLGKQLLSGGADGIVLACAAFGPFSSRLTAALDVPVCDGIGTGACLAYGLYASGVRTSKRGGYAPVHPPAETAAAGSGR
jgi:allantoin racemase